MNQNLTDSRRANIGAQTILGAFESYQSQFHELTARAQTRFENCDWHGMQADAAERLDLYKQVIDPLVAAIRELLADRVEDKFAWASMKAVYSGLIAERDDWELAETFFNSVTRRIFATVGVDSQIEFVDTDFDTPPTPSRETVYRTYAQAPTTAALIETILGDYDFRVPYADLSRDTRLVAAQIEQYLRAFGESTHVERAEMVKSVFYRGNGAYIIGRLVPSHSATVIPFVLALLNTPKGILVDAVLLTEDEVSILFSFTRSYFRVLAERPYDLVHFLKSIVPRKRVAELYISIGHNKHGKTEFYRHFLQHLSRAPDKFEIAPGARGMVMAVFTLPSFDAVFKIIKDRFDEPKTSTRERVMEKYRLVFKHDRAGRLIDAQEFEHLEIDRARFSEPLLRELERVAANTVRLGDDHVDIKHVYIERRVTPLNIYLGNGNAQANEAAVVDYGNAVKDLAAANIFPGDLLLKNFGVTRHGRVVFYDYDELTLITDCSFRALPQAQSDDEELSSEPWFYAGENDFFPEEFRTWLGLDGRWREVFMQHHADLFQVDSWRRIQERIRAGEVIHIFPYPQSKRFTLTDATENHTG